jgi:membrane protein
MGRNCIIRIMTSMWDRGGLTWRQLLVRVWREVWIDQVPGRCAELAYYFLFSVFPLLLFLSSLLGYLAGPESRLRRVLFRQLEHLSPAPDVTELLRRTLDQIIAGRGGARLSLSLLVALWVASAGMLAVARTLNSAFGVEESRPWWRRRLVAVGLTVGIAVLIICALAIIFYGHQIGQALAASLGIGPAFIVFWRALRWLLVVGFSLLAFDAVYNFAPDTGRGAGRRWGTPGGVIGVGLWLAASFGFRIYLDELREGIATTYGSLGVVIVLMLWFYLTALAILVGGEINSVIYRQLAALRRRGPVSGHAGHAGRAGNTGNGGSAGKRQRRGRTRRRAGPLR